MGMFQGMKDAKRGFQSNKLREGDYVVRIDRCDHITGDRAGDGFKITCTVLAVNAGDHHEGEVASVTYWKGSGKAAADQWLSNIKGFIGRVMGVTDDQIDEGATLQTLAEVYDEATRQTKPGQNVLGGTVARVTAQQRFSKSRRDESGNAVAYNLYGWNLALTPEEIESTLGAERTARFFPSGT
jgi:hypothetical protein